LTQVIVVAMLGGVVRLVRRGSPSLAAFGLLSVGILAIWHYLPNERFVLLVSVLLAGLVTELGNFWVSAQSFRL
jgi:hypothetical protein